MRAPHFVTSAKTLAVPLKSMRMQPWTPTFTASKPSRKSCWVDTYIGHEAVWFAVCEWCKAYRLVFRQFSLPRIITAKGWKGTSPAFTDTLPAFKTEMTAVKEALSSSATQLLLSADTFLYQLLWPASVLRSNSIPAQLFATLLQANPLW